MVGKTALNKEMKHLNGAYFRTITHVVKICLEHKLKYLLLAVLEGFQDFPKMVTW